MCLSLDMPANVSWAHSGVNRAQHIEHAVHLWLDTRLSRCHGGGMKTSSLNRARQIAALSHIRARLLNQLQVSMAAAPSGSQDGEVWEAMARACGLAERRRDDLVYGGGR